MKRFLVLEYAYNDNNSWWKLYAHTPIAAESSDELLETLQDGRYRIYELAPDAGFETTVQVTETVIKEVTVGNRIPLDS